MKTKLLLLALIVSAFGYSQHDGIPTGSGYYINKIMASPSGDDLTKELLEVRGPANAVVPTNLYFISIEGDGNSSSLGQVEEAIQLGDGVRTFGANGILVLIANYTQDSGGNTGLENLDGFYESFFDTYIHADATQIEIALAGNDLGSSSSSAVSTKTPDIGYDGNFIDQTGTYMLITADSSPKDDYIDGTGAGDADGVIDAGAGTDVMANNWLLYDSVAYMDDNDEGNGEYAYAQIIFAQDYANLSAVQFTTTSANVYSFSATSDANIMMRQDTRIGYTTNDWVASATSNNSNPPDWTFSSTTGKTLPAEYEGWEDLNTVYGQLNPALTTLSVDDFSTSNFKVYPNPARNFINIQSKNIKVSSVDMYNVLGAKVLSSELTNNRVNVSNLVKGVYFMKINADGGSAIKKVVVQ
tara:strand:- start:17424 stop:18662 length:1239 start_codon:yes stop_codon:yes gene_type:complete